MATSIWIITLIINMSVHQSASFNQTEIFRKYCPWTSLCDVFQESKLRMDCEVNVWCQTCRCDEKCAEYGDCCPDVIEISKDFTPEKSTHACPANDASQEILNTHAKDLYYVISTCSHKYSSNGTDVKCVAQINEHFNFELYVYSPETGNTYKNKQCAMCNEESDVIDWLVKITCPNSSPELTHASSETNLVFDARFHNCSFSQVPPNGIEARKCSHASDYLISSCNVTGDWLHHDPDLASVCMHFMLPFTHFGKVYKNIYCFLCNTGHNAPLQEDFCKEKQAVTTQPKFAAVFDVTERQLNSTANETSRNTLCYNTTEGRGCWIVCREVSCSPGKVLNYGVCTSLLQSVIGANYKHIILLRPRERIYLNISEFPKRPDVQWIYDLYKKGIREAPISVSSFVASVSIQRVSDGHMMPIGEKYNFLLKSILITTNMYTTSMYPVAKLEELLLSLDDQKWISPIASFGSGFWGITIPKMNFQRIEADGILQTHDLLNATSGINGSIVSHVSVCPSVTLNASEVDTTDNTMYIPSSNVTVPIDKYELLENGNVLVCVDDYLDAYTERNRSEDCLKLKPNPDFQMSPAGITFLVFNVASMCCLLVTLTTYCLFYKLRTLPGKINMFLVTMMLLGQMMMQGVSGVELGDTVCMVVGITIHFLHLSFFGWMNVSSYHIFIIFAGKKQAGMPKNAQRRTLLYYAMYSFGLSASIVAVTATVNYVISGDSRSGYGFYPIVAVEGLCFLNNEVTMYASALAPIFFVITANVIFFIISVYNIRRTPIVPGNTRERTYVFTCIKLSTLTGLTWMFMPLKLVIPEYSGYIYAVVSSTQGMFLFYAFTANKRVLRMYRKLCYAKYSDTSTERQSPTTYTKTGL